MIEFIFWGTGFLNTFQKKGKNLSSLLYDKILSGSLAGFGITIKIIQLKTFIVTKNMLHE